MSPTTVTAARRPRRSTAAQRRAIAQRRRRTLVGTGAVALLVVLGVTFLPLARKAVNDFGLPLRYTAAIRQQAAEKHLDPALIAAVIDAETKFDPRTSSAGAEGPMQLMPQTADFLAHRSGATSFSTADLNTPSVNIAYGSYYLRYLLNEYHSTWLALAAYNGGETNVDRWLAGARAAGTTFTISDIPYPETQAYVDRVLAAEQDYRHTYGAQLYSG